jgi:hypothetical protein
MQLSFTAQGTVAAVLASIDTQVANEKARIAAQHQRDRKIIPAAAADAHAGLEASASTALDGVVAFLRTDLGDAPADEQVACSVTITTHRPDR